MIVSLMKKAKKTYHSFQDELADYIKVQKARGLEPKTNFRKPEEESQREEFEAFSGQEEAIALDQDQFSHDTCEPGPHSIFVTETGVPSYTAEKRVPCWPPTLKNPLKLEDAPQLSIDPCLEKQPSSQLSPCKCEENDWSSDESLTFSDRSPSYSRGSQKTKQNQKEHAGDREESLCQQLPKPKRKRCRKEETLLSKGSEKQQPRPVTLNPATAWKAAKHGKDKGSKDGFSDKESRKHKKEKKKAKVSGPADEETLWNESVLGF